MNKYFAVFALLILVSMSQARVRTILELETTPIAMNSTTVATENKTTPLAHVAKRQLPCCSTYVRADTNCDPSC
jgi:hypothetical protein